MGEIHSPSFLFRVNTPPRKFTPEKRCFSNKNLPRRANNKVVSSGKVEKYMFWGKRCHNSGINYIEFHPNFVLYVPTYTFVRFIVGTCVVTSKVILIFLGL